MMVPAFRSFIPGRMLLMVRNVAVRLPSRDACHPASLVASRGPGCVKLPPAFATRMSIGPSSPSMRHRVSAVRLAAQAARGAVRRPRPAGRDVGPGARTAHRPMHRRLLALGALDAGLDGTLAARQEWRRQGLRVIVGRIREARDETIDLLFALTSFQTFDVLAGPTRTPADVAPIVLRAARAILDLPI